MDASQALGRIRIPQGWQVLAASARPWGGPPGVGILAVRAGTAWRARGEIHDRERGRAPEFSGLPFAVAAAAALEAVMRDQPQEAATSAAHIDRARAAIDATVPDIELLGDPLRRLPHILAFSCLYADGESIVTELDRQGIAVASGSACTSDTRRPSHVLAAMGVLTGGNVRLTLPIGCPPEHVDRLCAALPETVARIRAVVQADLRDR
jgi:cysteine desulfurase